MLPPPITSATSSPSPRTSTSSRASVSTVWASRPYSDEPMRASPESFSRTRRNAARCFRCGSAATRSRYGVPRVVAQLDPLLLEEAPDRVGRLVGAVPRLLGEHRLAEELLVQHALDDLVAHPFRLALHLVRVQEDLALGLDELRGNLVAGPVGRARERQVEREAPRDLRIAAGRGDDRTDLVGEAVHVVREHGAVVGREAVRADDLNVLAQLRSELHALLLEPGDRLLAALLHGP